MYSVGVFLAFDFLLFILMDIAYRLCPPKIIEKKQEYVLFSLDFLSLYFTLFIVITNIVKDHSFTHFLFWTLLFPVLFLFHLIYRFKTEKKSRHLCLRFSDKGIYTRSFRVQCYVNRIVVYFVSASISYLCGNDFSVIK